MMVPLASCTSETTAKAEAPPPEGSTATITWLTLERRERAASVMSIEMDMRWRLKSFSMSVDGKARCEPSAPMPIDSRSSMAGSSDRRERTTSCALNTLC